MQEDLEEMGVSGDVLERLMHAIARFFATNTFYVLYNYVYFTTNSLLT
jgi:hypothetical protein